MITIMITIMIMIMSTITINLRRLSTVKVQCRRQTMPLVSEHRRRVWPACRGYSAGRLLRHSLWRLFGHCTIPHSIALFLKKTSALHWRTSAWGRRLARTGSFRPATCPSANHRACSSVWCGSVAGPPAPCWRLPERPHGPMRIYSICSSKTGVQLHKSSPRFADSAFRLVPVPTISFCEFARSPYTVGSIVVGSIRATLLGSGPGVTFSIDMPQLQFVGARSLRNAGYGTAECAYY
jgi:hypothetical protein